MDPFSLLELPCRPYLDPEHLETSFRRLAATHHPDQATGSVHAFQQLQEAVTILRQPAKRLRALAGSLEAASSFPTAAADLFQTMGFALRQAEDVITRYHAAQGTLAKALLMQSLVAARTELTTAEESLQKWQQLLSDQLQSLDAAWPEVEATELLALADSFAFAQRWSDQLRERMLAFTTLLE